MSAQDLSFFDQSTNSRLSQGLTSDHSVHVHNIYDMQRSSISHYSIHGGFGSSILEMERSRSNCPGHRVGRC